MKLHAHTSAYIQQAYRQSRLSVKFADEFFQQLQTCPACRDALQTYLKRLAGEQLTPSREELFACCESGGLNLGIVVSAKALWAVSLDWASCQGYLSALNGRIRVVSRERLPDIGQQVWQAALEYMTSGQPLPVVELNLALVRSAFRREALLWTCLIPYGRTATYGELAGLMGRAGAARAVGGAEKANPVPLFIPCHRVIGAGGGLVGFGGGLPLKQKLLQLEQDYLRKCS